MTSAGIGDQPVNKKDLTRERFESLLKKRGTKENSITLTREKLLTLIAEVKSAKTAQKKVPRDYWLLQHSEITGTINSSTPGNSRSRKVNYVSSGCKT
ncbi:hypothetical protein NPIL_287031 [Nephila pilipes]|uniref:Uncharacterized protein n=1 Tax=Nephila pilipes TaxID=299642 RepID=A0A8X6UW71_NEPPI|nr:hypothetical protein NPIL_287031 [Nephila pilipes]